MINLCPYCEADLEAWVDTFGEPHSCEDFDKQIKQSIIRITNILRRHGVPVLMPNEVTTPELEKEIKGEG